MRRKAKGSTPSLPSRSAATGPQFGLRKVLLTPLVLMINTWVGFSPRITWIVSLAGSWSHPTKAQEKTRAATAVGPAAALSRCFPVAGVGGALASCRPKPGDLKRDLMPLRKVARGYLPFFFLAAFFFFLATVHSSVKGSATSRCLLLPKQHG